MIKETAHKNRPEWKGSNFQNAKARPAPRRTDAGKFTVGHGEIVGASQVTRADHPRLEVRAAGSLRSGGPGSSKTIGKLYRRKYFQPGNPRSREPSTEDEGRLKTEKELQFPLPVAPFSGSY